MKIIRKIKNFFKVESVTTSTEPKDVNVSLKLTVPANQSVELIETIQEFINDLAEGWYELDCSIKESAITCSDIVNVTPKVIDFPIPKIEVK